MTYVMTINTYDLYYDYTDLQPILWLLTLTTYVLTIHTYDLFYDYTHDLCYDYDHVWPMFRL